MFLLLTLIIRYLYFYILFMILDLLRKFMILLGLFFVGLLMHSIYSQLTNRI